MVTNPAEDDSDSQTELADDDEEDLCRVWDMAMDKVFSMLSLLSVVWKLCVFLSLVTL